MAPVHLAVFAGAGGAGVVAALLSDPRTDPNLVDAGGRTALHIAVMMGNEAVLRVLAADPRVMVDALAREEGMTALHIAAMHDHLESVRALLEGPRAADPNAREPKLGRTALHLAVAHSRGEVTAALLSDPRTEAGAMGVDGVAPLHIAVYNDTGPAIAALLAHGGADPNALHQNHTPLHIAAIKDRLPAIVHLLADARVDTRAVSSTTGYSVLHFAAEHASANVVRFLLGLAPGRVDVNARAKGGLTPLHVAAAKGRIEALVALLADPRVDPTLVDEAGSTALHQAAFLGHPQAAAALLADLRVDPNASAARADGFTPLHMAALRGHDRVAAVLLADPRAWGGGACGSSSLPPLPYPTCMLLLQASIPT